MTERLYTDRVGEALRFAAEAHAEQARKGKPDEPYLSHILIVAGMVAHYGGDEDQIIAGVLHDAVEDAGGEAMADDDPTPVRRAGGRHRARVQRRGPG